MGGIDLDTKKFKKELKQLFCKHKSMTYEIEAKFSPFNLPYGSKYLDPKNYIVKGHTLISAYTCPRRNKLIFKVDTNKCFKCGRILNDTN